MSLSEKKIMMERTIHKVVGYENDTAIWKCQVCEFKSQTGSKGNTKLGEEREMQCHNPDGCRVKNPTPS